MPILQTVMISVALIAHQTPSQHYSFDGTSQQFKVLTSAGEEVSVPTADMTEYLSNMIAGKTIKTDGPGGTQVSYAHENGQVYLWHARNDVILEGLWEVSMRDVDDPTSVHQVCYTYRSPNGTTYPENCHLAANLVWADVYGVSQTQPGDVLDLQSMSVPERSITAPLPEAQN